ncbi:MAG: hypothetical protein LBN32_00645 [Helicobacteraceae bacterium]|nr:hypothetical protein [Helicobacteraceae bacterium]
MNCFIFRVDETLFAIACASVRRLAFIDEAIDDDKQTVSFATLFERETLALRHYADMKDGGALLLPPIEDERVIDGDKWRALPRFFAASKRLSIYKSAAFFDNCAIVLLDHSRLVTR